MDQQPSVFNDKSAGGESLGQSVSAVNLMSDTPQPMGNPVPSPISRANVNRRTLIITGSIAAIAAIILIAALGLLLTKNSNSSNNSLGSYGSTSSPLSSVSGITQLPVTSSQTLAVNGQLQVNKSLVLSPSSAPSTPTLGEIYYNSATNTPYYFNGSSFVSFTPTPTTVGGASGAIGLGNGLTVNNNQLAVSSSLLQSVTNGLTPKVASVQGQTGSVNFVAGNGITIDGTTIGVNGATITSDVLGSLQAGNGISVNGGQITNTGVVALTSNGNSIRIIPEGNGIFDLENSNGGSGGVTNITSNDNSIAVTNDGFGGYNVQVATDGVVAGSYGGASTAATFTLNGSGQITNAASVPIAINGNQITSGKVANTYLNTDVALYDNGTSNFTGALQQGGYNVCTTNGNCVGVPGGSIGGSGTSGAIAMFTGLGYTIGNSALTQTSGNLTDSGNLAIQGTGGLTIGTGSTTVTLKAGASGTPVFTLPSSAGMNGQCLITDGTGSLSFSSCLSGSSGGTGGVSSLDGLSGSLNLTQGTGLSIANGTNTISLGLANTTVTPSSYGSANSVATFSVNAQGQLTAAGNTQIALNGNQITSGTVGDAYLSANIAKYNDTTANFGGNLEQNSNKVCTTAGNCTGVAGGSLGGGGTNGVLPVFTGTGYTLGNSVLSQSDGDLTDSGYLAVEGSGGLILGSGTSTTAIKSSSSSPITFTLPGSTGTSGQCITTDGSGNLTFANCLSGSSGGSSGVASLNGLSGALSITQGSSISITTGVNSVSVGLANSGASAGSYGSASSVATYTVNAAGQITAAGSTPIAINGNQITSGTIGNNYLSADVALYDNATSNFTGALQQGGNNVCTTAGNCTGVAGGSVGGSGTSGTLAIFNGSGYTIGNSALTQSSGNLTASGNLRVQGTGGLVLGSGSSTTTIIGSSTSAITFTLPSTTGSANQCLVTDGNGNLSFVACATGGGGGGGVTSLNGLSGAVSLQDSSGELSFNPSGSNINISLPQNLNTTSSPTFSSLTLTNPLGIANGGTGQAAAPTSGQILIGKSTGSFALTTLTQGTGLNISNSSGAISLGIANTAVTAGSYGDGADVATFTVNAQGQLTAASSTPIAINGNQITSGTVSNGRLNTDVALYDNVTSNFTGALQQGGNNVCTTAGNCVGVSGGGVGGSGSAGSLAMFTGSGYTIGNSALTDTSGNIIDSGNLTVQGGGGITLGSGSNNTSIVSSATSPLTFTLPNSTGSNGQCLTTNGSGVLSFANCLSGSSGGSGGVSSLNGLSGGLTIAQGTGLNVSNGVSTITVGLANTAVTVGSYGDGADVATFTVNAQGQLTAAGTSAIAINGNQITSGKVGNTYLNTDVALYDNITSNFTGTLQQGGNNVCTTAGNCVGTAGGAIGGSGTAGTIALFTGSGYTVGNSVLTQASGNLTDTGNLIIQGSGGITLGSGSSITQLLSGSSSSISFTLPASTGSNGQCLTTNGSGVLSFANCLSGSSGGSGGVSSLNSLSGAVALQDSNNELTFTNSGQNINIHLPQGLATTDSPTFAGLTVSNGGSLIDNGSALFQDSTSSPTAFQVKNAGGVSVLSVDTSNQILTERNGNSYSTIGSELMTSNTNFSSGWSGTNWTNTSGGALHASGNTTPDVYSGFTPIAGTTYKIVFAFSGVTNNGSNAITPEIGGSQGQILYDSSATSETQILTAGTTANLEFVPTTGWTGTITSVSVMSVSSSNSSLNLLDSSGNLALQVRPSDYVDTFIGLGSGSSYTNGGFGDNVGLGAYSLQDVTTGYSNEALGTYALQFNTTGGNNIAIGDSALGFSTTGSSNIALGSYTLLNNTTGIGNTAIGADAGGGTFTSENTANSYDTFLGYKSGSTNANLLQNSTAIGAYSTVTKSNSLALGCVSGVNGCTATTQVGVGTNNPANLLSVGSLNTAASAYQLAISTGGTTNSGIVIQNVAGQSSGYAFQLQSSTGSSLASVDYQGNLIANSASLTTALSASNGGTGMSSYTQGSLLYASGSTSLGQLNDVATGSCLVSGGTSTAPSWGSCGVAGSVSGSGTSGQIALFNGTSTITGSSVLTQSSSAITDSGTFLIQPSTNSTTALMVTNTASVPVLTVDTSNQAVFVGTNTPVSTLPSTPNTSTLTAGTAPRFDSAGNLCNNGLSDIAVINSTSQTISLYCNNGNSGTTSLPTTATNTLNTGGYYPSGIAVGNFCNNGHTDIAIAAENSNNTASFGFIYCNTGSTGGAAFSTSSTKTLTVYNTAVAGAYGIVAGNFCGNNKADIAIADNNTNNNRLNLFCNTGTAGSAAFSGTNSQVVGSAYAYLGAMATGNFCGNGRADIVVSLSATSGFALYCNSGSSFASATYFGSPISNYSLTSGNLCNNGKSDLAASNNAVSGSVLVFCNTGTGFSSVTTTLSSITWPLGVTTGNLCGNSRTDLGVATSTGISLYCNTGGAGSLALPATPTSTTSAGTSGYGLINANLCNNSKQDQALVNGNTSGTVTLVCTNGGGQITGALQVTSKSAATPTLILQSAASQSADVFDTYNNSGAALVNINSAGDLCVLISPCATTADLQVGGATLIETGTNTASAFQVQNSSGINLLGVDTSGNNVNIGSTGSSALASTVNIGTSSTTTNAQAINIGSSSDTSNTVSIEGGTGASAIQIGNGATAHGIKIGTGAAVQTIAIGSTNSSSALTLAAGTGGLSVQTQGTGTLGIGNNAVAQVLAIGNSTGATSVNIQAGTGGLTIQSQGGTTGIDNNAIAQTIAIGNSTGATSLALQSGTGGINLGTSGIANTIQIGNTSGAVTQTINLGNNATASSVTSVTIGSQVGTSATTIQGGTGNITLEANGSSNTGVLVKASNNSTAALQVQTTGSTSVLGVDTTNQTVTINQGAVSSSWQANPYSLPSAGYNTASFTYAGYLYEVIGSTIYRAQPSGNGTTGAWSSVGTFSGNDTYMSAAIYNGYVFIFSSNHLDNTVGCGGGASKIYSASINGSGVIGTWTQQGSGYNGYYGTLQAYNGYLYLSGLFNTAGGCGGYLASTVNAIYSMPIGSGGTIGSVTTNTWPARTGGAYATIYNGYLYTFGGWGGTTNNTVIANAYSAQINSGTGALSSSTTTTSLPAALYSSTSSAQVYNGIVYIVGGGTSSPVNTTYAANLISGAVGTWSTLSTLPQANWEQGNLLSGSYLYSVGGFGSGPGLTTVEYLSLSGANNLLQVQDNGTNVITASNTGNLLLHPAVDSTTVFQVQNAAGTAIPFDVDTQNGWVGVGTGSPANLLSVGALTTAAGTYQIAVSTNGTTNSGIVVQDVASQSSGYAFQLQDNSGASLASIDYQGNLSVKAATISGTLTVNGHIVTTNASGSTTAAVNANAGTSATCSVTGDDTDGQISLTTGSAAWASGTQCTISFSSSYSGTPNTVISPTGTTNGMSVVPTVTPSSSGFTVNFVIPDTASHTYTWDYANLN